MRAHRSAIVALLLGACGPDAATDLGRAFVALHAEHARDVDARELKHRVVASLSGGTPAPTGLTGAALGDAIAMRTNIAFLLDGLDAHYRERVTVTRALVAREGDRATYVLTVEDPALPRPIEALVVAPAAFEFPDEGEDAAEDDDEASAPPIVLGLHGHDQSPDAFRRDRLGNELADRGFVVIVPDFELFDCSNSEAATSALLLEHGFTLIGIRIYQSLALLEIARPWTASPRVGILGHSGGSALARLITPFVDGDVARVLDYRSLHNDLCHGQIHCETVPDLYEISGDINAPDHGVDTLDVPYGFASPASREDILRFFEGALW